MVAIGLPVPVWEEFVAEFLGVVVVVVGDVVEVVIISVCN